MAGLRRADPGRRLAIAWFDAHGDFNTPDTTPSGNVWGMPFAMLCGRGDPDLVARRRRPDGHGAGRRAVRRAGARRGRSRGRSRRRGSRISAPGCSGRRPGIAALDGWAAAVGREVDAIYLAFDLDCLDVVRRLGADDAETGGLSLQTALAAGPDARLGDPGGGFGATAVTLANGDGPKTVDAIAQLAEAAFAAG